MKSSPTHQLHKNNVDEGQTIDGRVFWYQREGTKNTNWRNQRSHYDTSCHSWQSSCNKFQSMTSYVSQKYRLVVIWAVINLFIYTLENSDIKWSKCSFSACFFIAINSLQSQKIWNLPGQHAHKTTRSLWHMTQFWRRAQCSAAMMTSMTRMLWALLITTTYVIHRPLGKLSQAQQIRNILDSLRRLSQCCRVTYIPHNQGHI